MSGSTLRAGSASCTKGGIMVLNDQGGEQMSVSHDKTSTLRANTKHHEPTILATNHQHDRIYNDGIVRTMNADMGTGGNNVSAVHCLEVGWLQCNKDVSGPLLARQYKDPPLVSIGIDRASYNMGANAKYGMGIDEEKIGAETARGPGAVCVGPLMAQGYPDKLTHQDVMEGMYPEVCGTVRRLTPLECTRLQGYPDGWVDIGVWTDSKGKIRKESDTPKYKALGNSIALPFWQWLTDRIIEECDEKTMVSLFDGIGGFPLCWQRSGGETLWVSEIDEFCNAVTQRRFT